MIGKLIGGLEAVRSMRRAGRVVDDEMRRVAAQSVRVANEDPTRRSDAAYMLSRLDSSLQKEHKRRQARAAAAGLPDDSGGAAIEAVESLARRASEVAAGSSDRRDRAEADFNERMSALRQQRLRLLGEHARESVLAGSYI